MAVLYDFSNFDSCLEDVLNWKIIKRGDDKLFVKVRDEEVPYNPAFRLYLVCRGVDSNGGSGLPGIATNAVFPFFLVTS